MRRALGLNSGDLHFKDCLIHSAIVLSIALVISVVVSKTLWPGNVNLIHTVLELICIAIAVFTFVVVWYTARHNKSINHILGFGFLAVAIYDIFHVYYFDRYPIGYYDLSVRFWILGRLTEALVVIFVLYDMFKSPLNKWFSLLITITAALSVSFLLIYNPQLMPVLLTPDGVTPFKIVIEYFIIGLFIVSILKLRKEINRSGPITYKYILIALLLSVPAEINFTLFKNTSSFYMVFGHILKVIYYFYFFEGTFVSSILFPYKELKDTRDDMKEILDNLPLGIAMYDVESKVSFVNEKYLELFGCTAEDILGKASLEADEGIFTNDDFQCIKNKNSSPIHSCRHFKEYKNVQGSSICFSLNTLKLKNGLLVQFNDVRKEQELQDIKLQTYTILDSITNLVLMVDTGQKIIFVNNAFSDCVEMEQEQIIGMDLNEFNCRIGFVVTDRNGVEQSPAIRDYKDGEWYEASFTTLKGNRKIIRMYGGWIRNIDNEVNGYIGVGSDITQVKEEQKKIQEQEKLAVIGQLGTGIVHETKNFLASIKGYCQLLLQVIKDDKHIKYIKRIEDITSDVNGVIAGFLALAKPSDSVFDFISINELITSLRYMLDSPSFIKGVRIEFELTEVEVEIEGDEQRLKQVILNLAKNAIEAMTETKDPVLKISTSLNKLCREMQIIISDNGRGIPEKELVKIGQLFYTTKETGTGLGLSMCYRIVEEHKGKILVKSEIGEGTTFIVALPCIEETYEEMV